MEHGLTEQRSKLKRWTMRIGVLLGLCAVVVTYFADTFRFFTAPDPHLVFETRDDVRSYETLEQWPPARGRFENRGFIRCRGQDGVPAWCVPPNQKGAIRYSVPTSPGSRSMLVRLFFFRQNPASRSRLLVHHEGDPRPRFTFIDPHFVNARLDFSRALNGPGGHVTLEFEGENPGPQPDVMFQYFELRLFAEPLPLPPSIPWMTLAVVAFWLCFAAVVPWRRLLPLGAVFAVGFALRYSALVKVLFLPLTSDAAGYHQHAMHMQFFSESGFFSAGFGKREPLFIALLKATLWLLGNAETHIRLVSFVGSLVVIVLVYHVAAQMFGRTCALLGALLVSICLPLVLESAGGLRLEVELVLLLLFVWVAFPARRASPWLQAGLAGTIGALLTLTRVTYLFSVVPLLLLAFLGRKPRRPVAAALAILVVVTLQLPYRWNGYQRYGSPFWDIAVNVEELAAVEFSTGAYGGDLTPYRYLFGLHTASEVGVRMVRGFWKTLRTLEIIAFHRAIARATGLHVAFADWAFQIAGVVGFVLAGFRPAFRWIPATFLLLVLPIAFLVDAVPGGLDRRQLYQAFPLLAFGALLSIATVIRVVPLRSVVLR